MDIQTFSRESLSHPHLVFYCNCEIPVYRGEIKTFVAAIYETGKEALSGNHLPILHVSGVGRKEWSQALACIDILLDRNQSTRIRQSVESWLLQSETPEAESYLLCCEIRNEGRDEGPVLPASRFEPYSPYGKKSYPTKMVYKLSGKKNNVKK